MAPDLVGLAREFEAAAKTALTSDKSGSAEHVTPQNYLDYESPRLHDYATRAHAQIKDRMAELETAIESCSSDYRADAVLLMNYSGVAERAVAAAARLMNDPDQGVRNNVMRLLAVFLKQVPRQQVASIAANACGNLLQGGFFDRNKALSLLAHLMQDGAMALTDLDRHCTSQIESIARTSIAPQTGDFARTLLDRASRPSALTD